MLDSRDRGVARPLGRFEALLGDVEVVLELRTEAPLGVEGGLGAAVVELGGLPGGALVGEVALERGAVLARLLIGPVGAVDRGLRPLLGLVGAALRRLRELLGALGFPARALRVLLGDRAVDVRAARLLERRVALLGGLLGPASAVVRSSSA